MMLHERTHLHAQDYYYWKFAPKLTENLDKIALPENARFDGSGGFAVKGKGGPFCAAKEHRVP